MSEGKLKQLSLFEREKAKGTSSYVFKYNGIRAWNQDSFLQQKGKRQQSQAAGREIPTRCMEEIKRSPFCAQALEWVPQRDFAYLHSGSVQSLSWGTCSNNSFGPAAGTRWC